MVPIDQVQLDKRTELLSFTFFNIFKIDSFNIVSQRKIRKSTKKIRQILV